MLNKVSVLGSHLSEKSTQSYQNLSYGGSMYKVSPTIRLDSNTVLPTPKLKYHRTRLGYLNSVVRSSGYNIGQRDFTIIVSHAERQNRGQEDAHSKILLKESWYCHPETAIGYWVVSLQFRKSKH